MVMLSDSLEVPLAHLLCYRTGGHQPDSEEIRALAVRITQEMISCDQLRAKIFERVGVRWDLDVAIRRLFYVVCRGKRYGYAPDHNELGIIGATSNPMRKRPVRRESKAAARKLIGNLFQWILNNPMEGFGEPFDIHAEIRRRLGLNPRSHVFLTNPEMKAIAVQIWSERKAERREKSRMHAKLFIECVIRTQEKFQTDWITPSILLEHYSEGLFGNIGIRPGFIDDTPEFYVEVNDEFLEALPLLPWEPPPLRRFPDRRRGGHLKRGRKRFHLLELMGSALASYVYFGPHSRWDEFYGFLDTMFIALRNEGHNILVPEGPREEADYHAHNILAGLENIRLTALEVNPDSFFRPWYWRKPPAWWSKNWLIEWERREAESDKIRN